MSEDMSIKIDEHEAYTAQENTFILPVGDVILWDVHHDGENYVPQGGEHCAVTQIWWIAEKHSAALIKACEPWNKNGLKLMFGQPGEGTDECPARIETEEQQRGPNMAYAASSRGVGAYIGDRWVWLEITDTEKLYAYMLKHSDIPVAVKCDVLRYTSDDRYRQVYDIANEYFQYYYMMKKPKVLTKTVRTEKQRLEEMYDV